MAIVAGFIAWIFEKGENGEEFQRAFLKGWFDGFWWRFVSTTTVGFGDKCPKTIFGRIFSVLWILFGIICFGILTASLTSKILNLSNVPTMKGANVGSLRNRIYESHLITEHDASPSPTENLFFKNGGLLNGSEGKSIDKYGVLELIYKLYTNEINGFLLDKYTFFYMFSYFQNISMQKESYKHLREDLIIRLQEMSRHSERQHEITVRKGASSAEETLDEMLKYFLQNTVQTQITNFGESLAYGWLVKNVTVYDYVKDTIIDNEIVYNNIMAQRWKMPKHEESDMYAFSPTEISLKQLIIVFCVILVFMICFGVLYERNRRKNRAPTKYDVKEKRQGGHLYESSETFV